MTKVNPIPTNYPRVIPSLAVDGAAKAIDFYCDVLGATERLRMDMPGDKVAHAELQIGDGLIMLADEFPDMNHLGPKSIGGTPVTIMVYVEHVDATFERALGAGAVEERPVADAFYGDRSGIFVDPWGHRWCVSSHIEDVSPEEMERRSQQEMPST